MGKDVEGSVLIGVPDGQLAMTFLDRLVEGAIIPKVKGESYRAEKAKTLPEKHAIPNGIRLRRRWTIA